MSSKVFNPKGKSQVKEKKGHTDAITALLPLPKLQFLASASLDNNIILWDTIKLEKRREYAGYHKRGVISLEFNENLIILLSAGIDHNIFVWNPYIDSPVYCLKGHMSSISCMQILKYPLHLVSMDEDSFVKIWDIQRLKCIYTFSLKNKENFQNSKYKVDFYYKLIYSAFFRNFKSNQTTLLSSTCRSIQL